MEDSPLTFGPTCSNATTPVCLGCYKSLKQKKVFLVKNPFEHNFHPSSLKKRCYVPSAVGQCAAKSVHEESHMLILNVNSSGTKDQLKDGLWV